MATAHVPSETDTSPSVTTAATARDGRSLLFAMAFGALVAALMIFAAWWWLAQPTPAALTLEAPTSATQVAAPAAAAPAFADPALADPALADPALANPATVEPLAADTPSPAQPSRSIGVQIVGGALININSATLAELETLPGIGPAKAQAIIDGRPYASVDALDDVPGIGPATLEGLRSLVSTE